jgi:hypothetical protein
MINFTHPTYALISDSFRNYAECWTQKEDVLKRDMHLYKGKEYSFLTEEDIAELKIFSS